MKRGRPIKRNTPLKNHSWRRRPDLAAALWRDARDLALVRDAYRCRLPGWKPNHECFGRLEVHHIRRRSQGGGNELTNLVTLCSKAHAWVHANPAAAYDLGLLVRGAA